MPGTFHTFSDNFLVTAGQITAAASGTAASAIVDTQQYRRAAVIYTASVSGTGSTADCKLQESTGGTAGSTWTDVASAAFGTLTATSTGAAVAATQVLNVDLAKRQRYLRTLYTGAGSTNTGEVVTVFILGEPQTAAVTNTPTPVTV